MLPTGTARGVPWYDVAAIGDSITWGNGIGKRTLARRLVQASSFVVFVLLTVAAPGQDVWLLPDELFSRLDPLVALTAVIASRSLIGFGALAILVIALTVVFGRAWCGWVCPVGAMLDTVPARKESPSKRLSRSWGLGRYVVLAAVLVGALLGTLWPMILDPITIATRPLQELVMPYFGVDALGASAGTLISRDSVPGVAFLSLVPLVLVLALNAVARRTWCRTLCPLGALLALISKVSGIRRTVYDSCTSCAVCARGCPTGAIEYGGDYASGSSDCITCLKCSDQCPSDAIRFEWSPAQPVTPGFDPGRREALGTIGATTAAIAATVVLPAAGDDQYIMRPPSTDEERLAQLCVRCGACFAACPTGVLRPSTALTSASGLWTPMLDERPVHCTLECNLCAEVCPTDALHTPTLMEAVALGLGKHAKVDRTRCRAWARGKNCMECLRACPIRGAIVSGRDTERGRQWGAIVPVPEVVEDLCVACDECARACPELYPAIGTGVQAR